MLQLSYVANRSLKSPGARALNLINPATGKRTNPNIGEIDLTDGTNRRSYNALQASLRHRFSHGLAASANYTWAKVLIFGNEDSFAPSAVQDWSNIAASRGPGALDVRHTFELDATWEIPIGRLSSNRWIRNILGGWVFSNIDQIRSGLPVNFVTGRDIRGDGFPSTQRPNYLGGSFYPASQSIIQWFNKAAFANPATGTFGNVSYNAGRGPGRVQVDASFTKRFHLSERQALDFRAEAFNLLNRPNFLQPDGNINSATFGQITSADNPRQLQLSLRYQF